MEWIFISGRRLPELLENLADIKGIEWIRLHYAYPAAFPLDVIRVMKERPNICNYLDIPFQHASDKVLQMMRRNHDRKQNYELIDFIRKEIPDITLRTTLMTGHPGRRGGRICRTEAVCRGGKVRQTGRICLFRRGRYLGCRKI